MSLELEKPKIYKSRVCSDINNIRTEVRNVIEFLQRVWGPVEECTLFELKVILNELLSNAIKHGNRQDIRKCAKVSARINRGNYLCLAVEDDGEGCDYNSVLKNAIDSVTETDIFNMKETGRGLLIVQSLSNSVKFNPKGNKIVVEKKLTKQMYE